MTSRPRSSGFTGLCHPALAVPSPGGGKDGSILVKMHQIRAEGEKASVNYGESIRGLSLRHCRIFIEGFVCVCIFKFFFLYV